jgi:PiT family inorganic phosphate transporter
LTALFAYSGLTGEPIFPIWAIVSSAALMTLGASLGGWRIVRTVGDRLTTVAPAQGFAAMTVAGGLLVSAGFTGLPVAATHLVSSSIVGAGAARGARFVRWEVAVNVLIFWLLTLPACFFLGFAIMGVLQSLLPGS